MGHVRGLVLTPTLPWLACRTRQQRREGFNPALRCQQRTLSQQCFPWAPSSPGSLVTKGTEEKLQAEYLAQGLASPCVKHTPFMVR